MDEPPPKSFETPNQWPESTARTGSQPITAICGQPAQRGRWAARSDDGRLGAGGGRDTPRQHERTAGGSWEGAREGEVEEGAAVGRGRAAGRTLRYG